MPWKSNAQRKYMWAEHPDVAREFEDATPEDAHLPEHVAKKPRPGRRFKKLKKYLGDED